MNDRPYPCRYGHCSCYEEGFQCCDCNQEPNALDDDEDYFDDDEED